MFRKMGIYAIELHFQVDVNNNAKKENEPETRLYFSNQRCYDPQLGRIIYEKPIKDGNNWYIYAANNPLRFIDPTGLEVAVSEFSANLKLMPNTYTSPSKSFRGTKKANRNTKMGALRAIGKNGAYTGFKWAFTAGKVNNDYMASMQSNSSFSFFSDSESNELIDPANSGFLIDTYHMIATVDGLLANNGLGDLPGWAGDLQTLSSEVMMAEGNPATVAEELMGNNSSTFSMSDLLSDIDGHNIANIMRKDSSLDFSTAFDSYYNEGGVDKRYSSFVDSYGGLDRLKKLTYINSEGPLSDSVTDDVRTSVTDAFMNKIQEGYASENE